MRSYNSRFPRWAKGTKRLKRLKKMTRDGKKRNVSATALQRKEGKCFHNRDETQSCLRKKTKPDLLGLGHFYAGRNIRPY